MTELTAADQPLKRLALDRLHRELGARMGGFAGYDMPIQYSAGLKAEHMHTRGQAGLFDVSHMGQLRVTPSADAGELSDVSGGSRAISSGSPALSLHAELEAALPVDFAGWPPPDAKGIGQQKYSYLLNELGGIEDDLMLVNLGSEVRIIVNAGNRDTDLSRLEGLAPHLRFEWIDAALLALQGPSAESVLAALDPKAAELRFMQSASLNLLGVECFATRSGYTGEDGYEISIPSINADKIARRLLEDPRVKPIGLGARDTLRLEAGLPLHGNDIAPDTTPVEAGLQFAIPKSRRTGGAKAGGFPGSDVILGQLATGVARKLVGLISEENIPIRSHAMIVDEQDQTVGEVTSGTLSPSLSKPVMLAYMDSAGLAILQANPGVRLRAVVRDKRPIVKVSPLPFVMKQYKR